MTKRKVEEQDRIRWMIASTAKQLKGETRGRSQNSCLVRTGPKLVSLLHKRAECALQIISFP